MKLLKLIIYLPYVVIGGVLLMIDIIYTCFTDKNIDLFDRYYDLEDKF